MKKSLALSCLFLVALISKTSIAQVTADIAQGQSPYGVYQVGNIDSVNVVNGNLSLRIPLLNYPEVGKDLRMDFHIYSNDKQWYIGNFKDVLQANGSFYWEGQWTGPAIQNEPTPPMVGAYVARDQDVIFGQDESTQSYTVGESYSEYAVTTNFYGQYVMEANGAKHYIGDSETQSCAIVGGSAQCPTVWSNYGATYPATDGTNWTSLSDPNGNRYNRVSSSETTETDTNGNQIVTSSSGWTDSVSRSFPGSQLGPGAQYQTNVPGITVPGIPLAQGSIGNCPSETTSAREWIVPAHNSSKETYYLCYSNFSYQTAFDVNSALNTTIYGVSEVSSSSQGYSPALLLSAVVLPNGTSYTFAYDQYLSLTQVTLPTGGSIDYTWQNVPFFQSSNIPISRAVATRTLNPGNGQPSQTWTYHWYLTFSYSNVGGVNIPTLTYPVWSVVTDPAGNDEEHQLGSTDDSGTNYLQLVETKVQSYAGCGPHDTASNRTCSPSGGTLQNTVSYILSQYGSGGANVNTPPFVSNPLLKPTTTTTTLPISGGSNLVSRTVITPTPKYGSCQLYEGLSLQPQAGVSNPAPTYQTISPCYSTNQTQSTSYYDFGVSSPGSLLKTDTMNYLWQTSSSYLNANLVSLVSSTVTTNASGSTAAQTTYGYDANNGSPQGALGNLTSVTSVNNVGASPESQTAYNSQGMATLLTDASGNMTSISSYQCSGAFPEKIIKPYQSSTTLSESASYVYDCSTGLMTSMTDPNNRTTSYTYSDPLNRLTLTQYPDGGSLQYQYNDTASPVNVTASQTLTASTKKQTEYQVDGLGRLIHLRLLSDPAGADITDANYDTLGRIASVSNPYRSTSDPTYGVTTFTYDALSRKVIQTQPDGSKLQWCYNGLASQGQGNCTANKSSATTGSWVDYSDEAGLHWQQVSDSLGRMTAVMEPNSSNTPGLETDYGYDTLADLLSVKQWGGRNGSPAPNGPLLRTFTYDSLSRLLSATNPESGTISYSYDANGNVLSKTGPAPDAPAGSTQTVITTYNYDALNRMTQKAFGTYAYAYQYDASGSLFTSSNSIGRLTVASNQSNASEQFSYDPMGRVAWEAHTLPDSCCGTAAEATSNAISASYNLAGDITSLTYPDTRVVTQNWNTAGQLTSVNFSSYNNGYGVNYPYLASASYFPNGSSQSMTFGNGVVSTISANIRQQPTEISLQATANGLNQKIFDKLFCYGPANSVCPVRGSGYDNGNIWAIADGQNSNRSISAYYDTLNRISSFNNGNNTMVQTYAIDPFGNMNQTSPGTSQSNLSFNGNNQISTPNFKYDAAGNLTQAYFGAGIYQYFSFDPESKLTNFNNGAATYTYDAQGSRIRKDFGGTWTEYVYFNGQPVAEKNANGSWSDYIFANGQRIARADTYDARIHVSGTSPGGALASWQIGAGAGYVIKSGDTLCLRQFQSNGYGGPNIQFTDGSQTYGVLVDSAGQPIAAFQTEMAWVDRTANLSAFAGKIVNDYQVITDTTSPAGNYSIYYGDIAIVSSDGTVTSIYDGQQGATFATAYNTGQTNLNAIEEASDLTGDAEQPMNVTAFYHGDHIGSARVVTAAGGWPISSDDFYPFGLEQIPPPDPNHYKFTGKERDAESGLDYFGARYYGSNMGRFMSPDWTKKPTAVPYADFTNPQTLNLYQYMRNNPLGGADKDGHCDWCQKLLNGITGNGFQTNAQLTAQQQQQQQATVTTTETYSLPTNPQPTSEAEPKEPNGQVDLAASAAGVLSAAPGVVPGAPGLLLGLGAAGVSSANDPSGLNLSINATGGALGVVSYAAEGTAVGTGAAAGGFGVAVGAMAWSGSNWISTNVITPVFTPDANQSNTINANGVTIQAPDAYDWHQP